MKNLLYILIFVLSACTNEKSAIIKKQDVITGKPKDFLDGVWGMSNYFDTILEKKEIAKYRLQEPSWFGIILKINGKSLISYGSIYKKSQTINTNSDTIGSFNHYEHKWLLIKKDSLLTLIRYDSTAKETKKYIYRKRNDLSHLIKNVPVELVYESPFSNNVTEYFNQKILSGDYVNISTNEKITFTKDGKIKGLKGYDSYRIRNYFGTLHPHNNLDVVRLINSYNNTTKELNWVFKNDKLILSDFKVEIVKRFGKMTPTDNYVLGKKIMILKVNK